MILTSRLAQIHRGRASVEDLLHGGAAFEVFLPAASRTDAAAPERPGEGGARPPLEDGAIAI